MPGPPGRSAQRPQPPPAAPQDGALGQEAASGAVEEAANVESMRSVSSWPHSGHGAGVEDWDIERIRAKTAPQLGHRYS